MAILRFWFVSHGEAKRRALCCCVFISVQTASVCPRAALRPATSLHLNPTNRRKAFALTLLSRGATRARCFFFFVTAEKMAAARRSFPFRTLVLTCSWQRSGNLKGRREQRSRLEETAVAFCPFDSFLLKQVKHF